jgi:hypothetical protein
VSGLTIIAASLATFGAIIALVVWLVRKSRRQQQALSAVAQVFVHQMNRLGTLEDNANAPRNKRVNQWRIGRGERSYLGWATTPGRGNNPGHYWLSGEIRAVAGGKLSAPFRAPADRAVQARLPRMRLRPETKRDAFGKKLRLNREVQTGDAAFDAAVYIESDNASEEVEAVLSSPKLRQAVLALFALGCSDVGLNYERRPISVAWRTLRTHNAFGGDSIERALELMGVMQDELPGFASVATDTSWARGTALMIAAVFGAGLGFLPASVGAHWYQPVVSTAGLLFPLLAAITLLCVVACWLYLRGSSAALRAFAWSAGLGLIAIPLNVGGAIVIANGALDSERHEQRVTIIKRWISKSDDSKSYHIRVSPWPPHEKPVKITIDSSDYQRLSNPQATLRFGAGAFGIEWYDGVTAYE